MDWGPSGFCPPAWCPFDRLFSELTSLAYNLVDFSEWVRLRWVLLEWARGGQKDEQGQHCKGHLSVHG